MPTSSARCTSPSAVVVEPRSTKVMKQQPAVFLKLLVLLVPREMKIEHSGGVKAMTDEQLEAGIEAIQRKLEARASGDLPRVIEGVAEPAALPAPAP